MFNRKEEHILAHLFVCFLAYLLVSLLELDMKRQGIRMTAETMVKRLRRKRVEEERDLDVDEEAKTYLRRLERRRRQ